MLTKSYEIDGRGRWSRRIADFMEDIVVACAACGTERQGRFVWHGDDFTFFACRSQAEQA